MSDVFKKTRYLWKRMLLDYDEKTYQSMKCKLIGGISENKDFLRTLLIWQFIE